MASAGNGGRANASADGGIVVIGKINSGGNRGNTINVGDIGGGATASARPARSPSTVAMSTTARTSTSTPAVARPSAMRQAAVATWPRPPAMTGGGGRGGPIRSATVLAPGGNGGGDGGDTASAGNGGIAGASADGGIVVIDEINSGGNQGNTIEVGDICAGPAVSVSVPPSPGKPGSPAIRGSLARPSRSRPANLLEAVVAARCG